MKEQLEEILKVLRERADISHDKTTNEGIAEFAIIHHVAQLERLMNNMEPILEYAAGHITAKQLIDQLKP